MLWLSSLRSQRCSMFDFQLSPNISWQTESFLLYNLLHTGRWISSHSPPMYLSLSTAHPLQIDTSFFFPKISMKWWLTIHLAFAYEMTFTGLRWVEHFWSEEFSSFDCLRLILEEKVVTETRRKPQQRNNAGQMCGPQRFSHSKPTEKQIVRNINFIVFVKDTDSRHIF